MCNAAALFENSKLCIIDIPGRKMSVSAHKCIPPFSTFKSLWVWSCLEVKVAMSQTNQLI